MSTNGLTDEAIAAYAAQLLDLEADIEAVQGDKKKVYENLRETYGKRAADSLKLAIKRHRMDADKRTEADEIDAEAERFLSIIRKPSAPRATHVSASSVPHDPETGEITEQAETPHQSTAALKASAPLPIIAETAGAGGEIDGAAQMPSEPAGTQAPPVDTHSEPAEVPPTPASAVASDGGAGSPAAASVVSRADRSKPHPYCNDPEDCGVEASWNHMCLSCYRAMEKAQAAVVAA